MRVSPSGVFWKDHWRLVEEGTLEIEDIVCVGLDRIPSQVLWGRGQDPILGFPDGAVTRHMALLKQNTLCK